VRCDYNGDNKVSAADALAILRKAVGLSGTPHCPAAAAADESGEASTTTTLPEAN